jgi:hypothetical protein
VVGICSGDCFIKGEICSRIRDTLVRSEGVEVFPESNDGGIKSGLTFAR